MLNGGNLDGSHLTVTSDSVKPDEPDHHEEGHTADKHIDQTDKPKAGSEWCLQDVGRTD